MVERNDELNSLIYGFLVKEQCYETGAYFLQDINYQVDNDTVKSKIRLEEVIVQYRKKGSCKHNACVDIGNIDDSSSSDDIDDDFFINSSYDSDNSDKSDVVYIKTNMQGVGLPSVNEIFGADPTQRNVVTNRKRIDLQLFREYKQHVGDLRVSRKFTIPYEASWSSKYYGANLGAIVHSIRQSLKANKLDYCEVELSELLEMGFIIDANEDKRQRVLLAFQLFIAKYGHADVPQQVIIDKNDETWPKDVRGFCLGNILQHIRNNGKHQEIHQQLIDIGVVLTPQIKTLTTEQVHNILVIYHQLHGKIDMNSKFVVPHTLDYPKYAWGYAIGKCVKDIANKGSHSTYNQQWEALGIKLANRIVKSSKYVSFDEICQAVECYKAFYGHLNMLKSYIVPPDDAFPSHLHGIKLGSTVYCMRNKGTFAQHKEKLLQLGIVVAKRSNESMRATSKTL